MHAPARAQVRDVCGLLADPSPLLRDAAARLAAGFLSEEAAQKVKVSEAPRSPGRCTSACGS